MPGSNNPSEYTIKKPNPQNTAKYLRPTLITMLKQASPEDVAWAYEKIAVLDGEIACLDAEGRSQFNRQYTQAIGHNEKFNPDKRGAAQSQRVGWDEYTQVCAALI